MKRLILGTATALLAGAAALFAANLPNIPNSPNFSEASQIIGTLNYLLGQVNSGVTVQSMAPVTNFRNLLDNGAMLVQQRGTGAATCATTSGIVALSYAADRWACDVNVTSGAGQLTVITATPSPPTGFSASMKLVRNSGALTQPQCAWHEVPTADVTAIQGQNVMFSTYLQALAGLAADNGNAATLVIITGTGTDQGLGGLRSAVGMTASPAITPAWTGLATLQTTTLAITTGWVRYNGIPVNVPTTVTELAVGVCFTPTASGQSATDGIAFVGAQLEVIGAGATSPSPYENRPKGIEYSKALRYYYQFAETNGFSVAAGSCIASNTPKVPIPLPVVMDTTPVTAWTVGGFTLSIAGATATAGTGGAGADLANGAVRGVINLAFTNTCTAGATVTLQGANTTGLLTVSADF